jgi:hypothetical protein
MKEKKRTFTAVKINQDMHPGMEAFMAQIPISKKKTDA